MSLNSIPKDIITTLFLTFFTDEVFNASLCKNFIGVLDIFIVLVIGVKVPY